MEMRCFYFEIYKSLTGNRCVQSVYEINLRCIVPPNECGKIIIFDRESHPEKHRRAVDRDWSSAARRFLVNDPASPAPLW